MIVVVDTNVAVVANRHSEQASPECVLMCVQHLNAIMSEGKLALDDEWHILKEYIIHLGREGQPGVGDRFLRWILLNQATGRCEFVRITPLEYDEGNFEEFPTDERLSAFDRSDCKFVAVAVAHPGHPPILQAVDSK